MALSIGAPRNSNVSMGTAPSGNLSLGSSSSLNTAAVPLGQAPNGYQGTSYNEQQSMPAGYQYNGVDFGSGTASGGGGGGAYDAAAAQASASASQRAQLQAQIDQLDAQQGVGLGNIGNSYNLGANRLDQQNAVAKRNYDTQVGMNGQNYSTTRNGIATNTRATSNALQRLLGMNGSGYSSASFEQVPYAAGLQGSQNLSSAQQTYGNNMAALDTNWQDTQRSYSNSLEDLGRQKFQQENSLKSSIAQSRANLLSQLQGADGTSQYQGQINDLLGQITGLSNQFANPVMRTSDISYAAPDLGQYSLTRNGIQSQNGGAQSELLPAFSNLLNQERDEFGNPIMG